MSWKAARNGVNVDLSGPVGDSLILNITSTATDYGAWTGWTWSGEIKQSPGAANVATFSIVDNSTADTLLLVCRVNDTTAWTAADSMLYGVQGTKSGTVVTVASGQVIPTKRWVD